MDHGNIESGRSLRGAVASFFALILAACIGVTVLPSVGRWPVVSIVTDMYSCNAVDVGIGYMTARHCVEGDDAFYRAPLADIVMVRARLGNPIECVVVRDHYVIMVTVEGGHQVERRGLLYFDGSLYVLGGVFMSEGGFSGSGVFTEDGKLVAIAVGRKKDTGEVIVSSPYVTCSMLKRHGRGEY